MLYALWRRAPPTAVFISRKGASKPANRPRQPHDHILIEKIGRGLRLACYAILRLLQLITV